MWGKQSECGEQAGPGLCAFLAPEAFAGPVWSLPGLWGSVRGGVAAASLSYPLDISVKGLSPTLGEAGVCNPALPPSSPSGGKRKQKPSGAGERWLSGGEREAGRVGRGCLVGLPALGTCLLAGKESRAQASLRGVLHQGQYPLRKDLKGPFSTRVGTHSGRVGRGLFPSN